MKAIIFIVSLCIVSASFAQEVSTDCVAMNEVTKEKVIKSEKPKSPVSKSASAQ